MLQVALTVLISTLSLALTYPLSNTAAYIYFACFTFVTFIAPAVLVWAQRYKKYVQPCLPSAWLSHTV